MQLYLFRELLGAIRAKSALFFVLSGTLLFLFLATVASFFMLAPTTPSSSTEGMPIEELRVFLSPRLSSATIDQWYLTWREREDIASLRFQFAQEVDETASGGVFIIAPEDLQQAERLAEEFRAVDGVTEVVAVPKVRVIESSSLSLTIRLALLAILLLSIAASLFCSRRGYAELLSTFSGEIRMLRLSGISERIVFVLVVALGLLIGTLGGLLLLAVLYLLHQFAVSNAAFLPLFRGLASGLRILGVGLASAALGMILGGLSGLLGASLLHQREFDPLP